MIKYQGYLSEKSLSVASSDLFGQHGIGGRCGEGGREWGAGGGRVEYEGLISVTISRFVVYVISLHFCNL